MPEKYTVTCACGYVMYVDSSAFGGTVECFMCSADLDVNESTAVPDKQSVDWAQNGVNASSEFRSADLPQGDSPAAPSTPSPFEDGDEWSPNAFEEKVDRRIAAPEPVEPEAPLAYHNPFGDDDDEAPGAPEDPSFSPEAQSTPKTTAERLADVDMPNRNKHVFIETSSALDEKTGEQCAECGRAIRGDWDRIKTAEGVICYVCSNQATHGIPDRVIDRKDKGKELTEQDLLVGGPKKSEPIELAPWYKDPQSDEFKRAVFILGAATVVFAIFISMSDWGRPTEEQIQATQAAAEAQIEIIVPLWATVVFWTWRVIAACLGFIVAFYFTLDHGNRLPKDTFIGNFMYIGTVLAIVTAIEVAMGLIYNFLVPGTIVGGFFFVPIWVFSVLFQMVIVNNLFDMRLRDWAWVMFFYFPISQFLLQGIGLFVSAGIYRIIS